MKKFLGRVLCGLSFHEEAIRQTSGGKMQLYCRRCGRFM
jgi:hypothetical protein